MFKKKGLDKQFSLFCCPADSKICLPLSRAPAKLKAALLRLVLIQAPVTCCHVWILSGNVTFGGFDSRSTAAIECRARMHLRAQHWPRVAAAPANARNVDQVNLKVHHSTEDQPANVGRTTDGRTKKPTKETDSYRSLLQSQRTAERVRDFVLFIRGSPRMA